MPNINITVAEKIATNMTPGVNIVCGNSDYNITFSFDSEWDGMEERTARFLFYKQGRSWFTDTKFTGDTVQVPVLAGVEFVLVGAYAGELHTTTPARILCHRSILCDNATEHVDGPTRENLEQLIAEVERQLESGAFVGPPGPKGADGTVAFEDLTEEQRESLRGPAGPQGPQGETGDPGEKGDPGEPGEDYVLTEADKNEIAKRAAALVEVPAPDTGGNAEVTALAEDVNQLKADLNKLVTETIYGQLIKDSYVEKDGTITDFTNWYRTDYIDVSNIEALKINNPSTAMPYCVFYKEDKTLLFNFYVIRGESYIYPPRNAKYMILSGNSAQMPDLELSIVAYSYDVMKKRIEELSKNGSEIININYVGSGYIQENDGDIQTALLWMHSEYVPIDFSSFKIDTDLVSEDATCNAFYDKDKNFLSKIDLSDKTIVVPDGAEYIRVSRRVSNYIYLYKQRKTSIKVCSFNVGIWTDGVSANARVADEDVPKQSVELRRFLGRIDADFVLCEEAVDTFNKSKTINSYEYCFENNLPYAWFVKEGSQEAKDSGVGASQMLLTSKYKMSNIQHHKYVNGTDTRSYMTFDVELDGKTINFIVAHASTEGSSDGVRQEQLAELASLLATYKYGILTGDFNTFSITEFDTHFSNFNMANHGYFGDFVTWPAEGWETWNKCLDNIITTKSIKIVNVEMGEVDMSDHRPLIAELELN